MRRGVLLLGLTVTLLVTPGAAQQPAAPAPADAAQAEKLRRGLELLKRLTLVPAQDAAIFASLPAQEPEDLLTAVMSAGQGYQSSPERWPDMHRAAAALVELALYRKQGFKAAIYESMQSMLYQNYDQNLVESLAASQRALALAEVHAPPEMQGAYLGNVGQGFFRLGRTDEALTFLRRARDASKALDVDRAHTWRTIVLAALATRDVAAAQAETDRFLEAARDASAPPVFRAYAHIARSDIQIDRGEFDGMLQSVQQALGAAGTDPDAEMLRFLAVSQVLQGVSAAALSLPYDEAIALARRIGKEFSHLPVSLEAFADGTIRRRRRVAGDLDSMLRADTAALAKARETGNPLTIAEALLAASLDYTWLNAARQAIGLLEEASELLAAELVNAKYPGSEGTAQLRLMVLTNLGLSYAEAGELERARAMWTEMVRVIDAVPAGFARQQMETSRTQALVGEARVAELEDNPERAAQLLTRALPLAVRKGGPSRSEVVSALARVYAAAAVAADTVATTYEQAIAAAGEEGDRDHQTAIRIAYARFLAVGAGQPLPDAARRATAQLEAAERDARELFLATATWKVEFGLGLIDEGAGRLDAAIARYQQAVATFEQMRAGLTLDENRQSFRDNKAVQELYERLVGALSRSGRREQAWNYLERDKARSFSEMLRGRRVAAAGPEPAELTEIEQRILRLKLALSPDNAPLLRASGREPAAVSSELRKLAAEYELTRQARDLKKGTTRGSDRLSSLPEVQQHLPAKTALLEYALLPGSVVVFVITKTAIQQVEVPVDGKRLRRDLLRLRRALGSPATTPEAEQLIASVSAPLVKPVEPHLAGLSHLIVIAAGAMNYVPFQVLRLEDGRQIVDAFAVSNLPSASTVPLLHATAIDGRSVFVGALGTVAVPGWSPLPGTAREAESIAAFYPAARTAIGVDFTSSRVLGALRQDNLVHLATHGDLDDQSPLFSAIITSPAAGESARVALFQLMDTPVKSELVVLSACQTATGKLLGGDEVTGLTRTLLLAGANAVVSTLWNIDDEVTAMLMRAFHRELKSGKSAADALRIASLELRKTHPDPAHWAPFVVTALE